jgi:hypothetical protein
VPRSEWKMQSGNHHSRRFFTKLRQYFLLFCCYEFPLLSRMHLKWSAVRKEGGTPWTHPLFGELLACSGFRRWNGALLLVVDLPDGSPGTIRADATDVFATEPTASIGVVLGGAGVQVLHALVAALGRPRSAAIGDEGK